MEKIEAQLKRLTPELSMHESQVLWSRVEGQLSSRGVKSPKKSTKRSVLRAITAGAVILGLLGGSVVTAYASESLPGDTLYSTKLTIERAQIIFAPVEKKKELQLAFANRRVKEVSAVLADIEEEQGRDTEDASIIEDTAIAEGVPVMLALAPETPTEVPEAPRPEVATFAMNVPLQEAKEEEKQDTSNTRPVARGKFAVPVPMAITTGENDIPLSIATNTAPPQVQMQTKKSLAPQRMKRWKNLEGKKKALTVAIRELERSRKELRENGATSTSDRVDEVIVSLTELNTTGTTADDTFVEKMKNSEVEVLPEAEEVPEEKAHKEEQKTEDADATSTLSVVQGSAIALSPDASLETEKEIEEVKVRNVERKKRFQAQVINAQSRERAGLWRGGKTLKRVPVCFDSGKALRELLVPEKDISKYLEHGFTPGACPTLATSTLPTE